MGTSAPSKTQVNPRSFHGLQCPDGPFPAEGTSWLAYARESVAGFAVGGKNPGTLRGSFGNSLPRQRAVAVVLRLVVRAFRVLESAQWTRRYFGGSTPCISPSWFSLRAPGPRR